MSAAAGSTLLPLGSRVASRRAGGWLAGVLLVIVCVAVYLPGFVALPPVDRDESRFAQASRQMAQGGDLVIPRVLGKPRLNKPPLIYWLQSGSACVLTGGDVGRDAIWMYRLPSLLAAIVAVLMTWRLGCALVDPRAALLAGVLLAICPVMAWEARQARADMVLVGAGVTALWALWRHMQHPRLGRAVFLWAIVGVGVLIKGPITPMIVLLTAGGLCLLGRGLHPFTRLRPLLGLVIVSLIVLPWTALVAHRVGLAEYASIVLDETLGRSLEPKEGHAGPPGYHTLLSFVIFFPGSLWTVAGLRRAAFAGLLLPVEGPWWRRLAGLRAAHAPEAFLLCALVPSWIVFELVSTKLPHYTMPLLPVLAIIAARAALSNSTPLLAWLRTRFVAASVQAWVLLGASLGIVVALLGWVAVSEGQAWGWIIVAIAGIVAIVFLAGGTKLVKVRDYRTLLTRAAWLSAILLILIGIILPRIQAPWVVKRLVEAAEAHAPDSPLAFVALHEDSSIFLTRGNAAWINAGDLPAWIASHANGLVVLPATDVPPADLPVRGLREITRVRGFNYPKGQAGEWILAEVAP